MSKSEALKVFNTLSTLAERLMQDTMKVAQDMGHHVVDPSHLVVAVLKSPLEYNTGSYPLTHPIRKGVVQEEVGLGLAFEPVMDFVAGFYPIPLEDAVVQPYTNAMERMLLGAYALAEEVHSRRDHPYDKVKVSVFDLTWAAIESGSVPLDRLIPDKERARHEFFRTDCVTASAATGMTAPMSTIRS